MIKTIHIFSVWLRASFDPIEINLILSHVGKHNPFLSYIHSGNYAKMVKTIKAKLLSLQINDYICVYICLSIQIQQKSLQTMIHDLRILKVPLAVNLIVENIPFKIKKLRMTTFIKKKFKISDDHTNIDQLQMLQNIIFIISN